MPGGHPANVLRVCRGAGKLWRLLWRIGVASTLWGASDPASCGTAPHT